MTASGFAPLGSICNVLLKTTSPSNLLGVVVAVFIPLYKENVFLLVELSSSEIIITINKHSSFHSIRHTLNRTFS